MSATLTESDPFRAGGHPYVRADAVLSCGMAPRPFRGRTLSGYGGRIPTRYTLTLADNRRRRVLAMSYGNSASFYVLVGGAPAFLPPDVEARLGELVLTSWPITHADGSPDRRYRVALEATGAPAARYVARFIGEYIGAAASADDAWRLAHAHNNNRRA